MRGGREFVVPSELQHLHDAAVERVISDHKKIIKDKPELGEAFEAFLREVDVPLIQRLIQKQLTRAGVSEDAVNRLGTSDICLSHDVYGFASHNFVTNKIKIDARVFQQYASMPMKPEQRARFLVTLAKIVIHEIIHSMSWIRGGFSTEQRGEHTHVHNDGTSGFHTNEGDDHGQFEGWNEAITERITDEILLVYARCKGFNTSHVRNLVLREHSAKHQNKNSYRTYRLMMQVVTERLAEYAGTTPEIIWRGIKERYFAGGIFKDDSIQALFRETFGEKFIADLSKFENGMGKRKLKRFMNKYHFRVDERTANRWFRELGLNYYLVPRHMQNKK